MRKTRDTQPERQETWLRIIGGEMRGRRFRYDGNPATRPMKDRVREAVFNLIGPAVREKMVVDLFAGTGAMAFEALSRGAARAVLVERRFPAVRVIQESALQLGIRDRVEVLASDAFVWNQHRPDLGTKSQLIFVCPPYDFFVQRGDAMQALIEDLFSSSPLNSLLVVESDDRFEGGKLSLLGSWDVRRYPPSVIAILQKQERSDAEPQLSSSTL